MYRLNEETKLRLIGVASRYEDHDLELFQAELGWEDWMSEFTDSADGEEITETESREIDGITSEIFNIAHHINRDMSKYNSFEIIEVNTKRDDMWTEWSGTDFEIAKKEKASAINRFDKYLTDREKQEIVLEFRAYSLPEDADFTDEDELEDAILNCGGWDEF